MFLSKVLSYVGAPTYDSIVLTSILFKI